MQLGTLRRHCHSQALLRRANGARDRRRTTLPCHGEKRGFNVGRVCRTCGMLSSKPISSQTARKWRPIFERAQDQRLSSSKDGGRRECEVPRPVVDPLCRAPDLIAIGLPSNSRTSFMQCLRPCPRATSPVGCFRASCCRLASLHIRFERAPPSAPSSRPDRLFSSHIEWGGLADQALPSQMAMHVWTRPSPPYPSDLACNWRRF